VLQLEQALIEAGGRILAYRIFAEAGFIHLLKDRPNGMIDEAIPALLFKTLFAALRDDSARRIAARAGDLTGEYILKQRIPAPVRLLLKTLPPEWAAPLLLKAIARHAWTFAGSGRCTVQTGKPAVVTIHANPLAMPGCAWHRGVFETLFRSLVSRQADVRHVACCNDRATDNQFLIDFPHTLRNNSPSRST
jgi:divinyl protochlorophyllide a 8-vinyl-reductase